MVLHLAAAVTGPAQHLRDGAPGNLTGAVCRQARPGRGRPHGPDTAGCGGLEMGPAAARCLSTGILFDCAGTRSRVAFPRNRREDSGGNGIPCSPLHGARQSKRRRSDQTGVTVSRGAESKEDTQGKSQLSAGRREGCPGRRRAVPCEQCEAKQAKQAKQSVRRRERAKWTQISVH